MRYPLEWKDRIIISVEPGFKRIKDVQLQTVLAIGEPYKFAGDIMMHYTKISSRYAALYNNLSINK